VIVYQRRQLVDARLPSIANALMDDDGNEVVKAAQDAKEEEEAAAAGKSFRAFDPRGSSATSSSTTSRSISNEDAIVKARNFALEIFANGEEPNRVIDELSIRRASRLCTGSSRESRERRSRNGARFVALCPSIELLIGDDSDKGA